MGYLASLAFEEDLSSFSEDIFNPKSECLLHYLAAQKKAEPLLSDLVDRLDPPFYFNLLIVCRWLKDIPLDREWRSRLMRQIIKIITQPDFEYALRANLVGALTASNDPAVSTLFRQLLVSPDEKLRILAALGCGAIQDLKSIHELALLLRDKNPDVRMAATLALGNIRSPAALEYVAEAFIQGDEMIKQAAAEALSWQGEEGIEALKNSYNSEDVLMRRAVVFGLANIKADWSRAMIEHIAVEDGQWVVRNAAVQALENANKPLVAIPDRLPPPSQASWLIAFAARQGEGIIPGKLPLELLISALDKGTSDEKLAALAYLRLISNEEVVSKVDQMAATEHGVLKDAAMLALWFFKVSGIKLPQN
jgi:HEAT repeat protein